LNFEVLGGGGKNSGSGEKFGGREKVGRRGKNLSYIITNIINIK
jgi:hypothetical protein